MTVGSKYPNMIVFRLALASHAVRNEFQYDIEKSDTGRYRAYCSKRIDGCKWRIHALTMRDSLTVKVKRKPYDHSCESTRRSGNVKQCSQSWVCEKVKDWVMENPRVTATELQRRLKDEYKVTVEYKRVYRGKGLAQTQLFGDWRESFNNLYRFKKEIDKSCPGSHVIIDHHTIGGKIRFNMLFFAMKPCIDGFLKGCRLYLAVDSTFLTGKFRGQLCVACAVDCHNWIYPIAFGVIDAETNENWIWFMERLKDAIGSPPGLTFSTDCGGPVMEGVSTVFPEAEHRECMWHLVQTFKKRHNGKVFDDHLWASAYSWNSYVFEKHWAAMAAAKPEAMQFLKDNHKKFGQGVNSTQYANCNHWVKAEKGRHLDDLMDALRQKLMIKWNHRRKIARQMEGKILKHIVNDLIKKSHNLDIEVVSSLDGIAEVRAKEGSGFRFVVNLDERTCSCRAWQVSGIPSKHALAFITSFSREKIEDHVDMYYSVEKFRAAYERTILALPDKSMWSKSDHGFFLHPPLLKSAADRKRNNRFKGPLEGGSSVKGKHQCPICKKYGHHWYTCKDGDPSDIAAMLADRGPPKKKQKKSAPAATKQALFLMVFPAIPNSTSTPSGAGNKVKKSKKANKTSTASTGSSVRSTAGSNQPSSELLPIDLPLSMLMPKQPQQPEQVGVKGKNSKPRKKKEEVAHKPDVTCTPAMSTRSKLPTSPDSPAMGTRSKRKLNLMISCMEINTKDVTRMKPRVGQAGKEASLENRAAKSTEEASLKNRAAKSTELNGS
ncbi:hypothetical protein U9M48_021561 [Paspalum notatum var. saurae]|uniref:SWIM-type domain-containing protein n=1 Tax=Paspalum notatum var. saurae TaxID=547442 RepID=A0AAQ3WTQ1_PASNO